MENNLEFLKYLLTEKKYRTYFNPSQYKNCIDYLDYIDKIRGRTVKKKEAIQLFSNAIKEIIGIFLFEHAYTCYLEKHTKKEKFVFTDLVIEGL